MTIRTIALVICTMLLNVSVSYGVNLNRTFTYTTSDTYCWIQSLGEDFDSDAANGNTSASSEVVDPDGTRVEADVNSLVTAPNSGATVARVNGSTATDSIFSPGYLDGNNQWHMGTTQNFAGFVETENTATSGGTLNHNVSFSFDAGYSNALGHLNATATVGNVKLYFSWQGGDVLTVKEYINGALANTYPVHGNDGLFEFTESYSQTVANGDTIEVDTYALLIDDVNEWSIPKTLTILAGTQ